MLLWAALERRSNDSADRRSEQLVAARRLGEQPTLFERCEGCWICPRLSGKTASSDTGSLSAERSDGPAMQRRADAAVRVFR
jgi:hypothetical protein